MNGLKRAQMDLDLAPEQYKQYYLNEIPERYSDKVDVRRFSPGERIVFLPYSEETFARTQDWIHERGIFPSSRNWITQVRWRHRPDYLTCASPG